MDSSAGKAFEQDLQHFIQVRDAIANGKPGEELTLTSIGGRLGVDAVGFGGRQQQGGSYCEGQGAVTGWFFKVRTQVTEEADD